MSSSDAIKTSIGVGGGVAGRAQPSLKHRALRGSAWTMVGFGASQSIRLATNLILTRLLFPEAFGLMALVLLVTQGLSMFSDLGLKAAIIRDPNGARPRFLRTAWTLQVIRGFILYLGALALAWPMAALFEAPQLRQLILVGGLLTIIAGFNAPGMALHRRRLAMGPVIGVELFSQCMAVGAMLAWAWYWQSVWALVGGTLVGGLVKMMLSHIWLDGPRPALRIHREHFHAIFHFSKWIFFASIIGFLATRLDRVFVGAWMDMGTLGLYHIAAMLGLTAMEAAGKLPLMSVFSRVFREQPKRIRELYGRVRLTRDAVFLTGYGILVMLGPVLIAILLDDRYLEAGWMLQLLALKGALLCMARPAEACLTASGRPIYGTIGRGINLLMVCTALPLGWHLGGLTGMLWAVALMEVPTLLLHAGAVHWHGYGRLRTDLASLGLFGAGLGMGWLIDHAVRSFDVVPAL